MEERQRNRRKVRKTRRKGYRQLLKKPLRGYSYRQKKFLQKKLEKRECVMEAVIESHAVAVQVPSWSLLRELSVCTAGKPQANSMLRGVRVLSLFDGIGFGYYALEDLGISVKAYSSSEIDERALSVLKFHYHDRITMLGSVSQITTEVLECLGQIDLLIGGSPCEQLGLCNPRRQGFMVSHITVQKQTLGCNPVLRCFSQYVPMARKRLFWGNIPELHSIATQSKEIPSMQSFLMPYHKAAVDKVRTLTTCVGSQSQGKERVLPVLLPNGSYQQLLVTEKERLFGLKPHWTDTGDLSFSDRRKLLGKSWSIDVVKEIWKPLTVKFEALH